MVSYYHPIVTLCILSFWVCVFEIWRHIGRKSPKKPNPPSFGTFLWGEPLRIFRWIIPCQKLEWWGYQKVYISRSCFRSARHNTGVWRTDVQTDRHTDRQTDRHVAETASSHDICLTISVHLPQVIQNLHAPSTGLPVVFSVLNHEAHYHGFVLIAYTLLA